MPSELEQIQILSFFDINQCVIRLDKFLGNLISFMFLINSITVFHYLLLLLRYFADFLDDLTLGTIT